MRFFTSRFSTSSQESDAAFRPQLTSLIDVMTILLVFLLKSFSVEGQLVTPSKNLQLPVSMQKTTPEVLPAIEITRSSIMVEGRTLVDNEMVVQRDTTVIPELSRWIASYVHQTGDTTGQHIMLQADRNVAFHVVRKVMATCSREGFDAFDILVIEKG